MATRGEEERSSRVRRRIGFLEDRAAYHRQVEGKNRLHISCAATLLRDAAALRLMLGESEPARSSLQSAGQMLVSIQAPTGFLLLELGGATWWDHEFKPHLDHLGATLAPSMEFDGGLDRPPEAPRLPPTLQLLSLLQALSLRAGRGLEPLDWEGALEARLAQASGASLEATGTPLPLYLELLGWVRQRHDTGGDMQGPHRTMLLALLLRRWEHLRVARQDKHHWLMLPKPWLLLDPDLLTLAVLLRVAKIEIRPDEFFSPSGDTRLLYFPFLAASALQMEEAAATVGL